MILRAFRLLLLSFIPTTATVLGVFGNVYLLGGTILTFC
jgi:hypothetical protein